MIRDCTLCGRTVETEGENPCEEQDCSMTPIQMSEEEEGVLTRRECGVAPAGLTGHQAFETSGKERG